MSGDLKRNDLVAMMIVLLRRHHGGTIRLPRAELAKQGMNKREIIWVTWAESDPRVTISIRTLPEDSKA